MPRTVPSIFLSGLPTGATPRPRGADAQPAAAHVAATSALQLEVRGPFVLRSARGEKRVDSLATLQRIARTCWNAGERPTIIGSAGEVLDIAHILALAPPPAVRSQAWAWLWTAVGATIAVCGLMVLVGVLRRPVRPAPADFPAAPAPAMAGLGDRAERWRTSVGDATRAQPAAPVPATVASVPAAGRVVTPERVVETAEEPPLPAPAPAQAPVAAAPVAVLDAVPPPSATTPPALAAPVRPAPPVPAGPLAPITAPYRTAPGTALSIDAAHGALAGRSAGADLRALLRSTPLHGAVGFYADGHFTYRPKPGFVGRDSFRIQIIDHGRSQDPQVVTVVVGDAP